MLVTFCLQDTPRLSATALTCACTHSASAEIGPCRSLLSSTLVVSHRDGCRAPYLRVMETAKQIIEFVSNRMRMSHVYQPLLIRALVRAGGSATLRQLDTALLVEDESQLLYYEDRIKEMPLPILRKHGIITSERNVVSLNAGKLSYEERAAIELACTQQLGSCSAVA